MNGEGEKEYVFPHFEGWFWGFLSDLKTAFVVKFLVFKCYLQGVLNER